ncbi:MAG: hypothetical protein R6V85_06295 [Polyangia bacterium]
MNKKRRLAAHVMLAAFLSWQLSAVMHLLLVTHVIQPDGSVADIDPETGESVPEQGGPNPLDDGCPYLYQITVSSALSSESVSAVVSIAVVEHVPLSREARRVDPGEEIYRLSPSNSPPSA